MTTIAAKQDKDGVHFAWDTQVSRGSYAVGEMDKVVCYQNGAIVIGSSGQARINNLLTTLKFDPLVETDFNPNDWMTNVFAPTVFEHFDQAKFAEVINGRYSGENSYIVAVRGTLYDVGANLSWNTSQEGLYAIGSGFGFAIGAMATGYSPAAAVEVASRFDVYTNSQIKTLDVPNGWA